MTRRSLAARVRSAITAFRAVVQFIHAPTISAEEFEAFAKLVVGDATAADLRRIELCVVREMNPHRRRRALS